MSCNERRATNQVPIGEPLRVTLERMRDAANDQPLAELAPTCTIVDSAGSSIDGINPVLMTNDGGGNYSGTIPASATSLLTEGQKVRVRFAAPGAVLRDLTATAAIRGAT